MTRLAFTGADTPAPGGPYSQGVEAGGFFYTAGFGPHDPTTGEVPEGIAAQTHRVMASLKSVLEARNLDFDHVVKVTVHLSDMKYFAEFNAVYETYFSAPYPVRTTVGSQLVGFDVEIDFVAAIPDA